MLPLDFSLGLGLDFTFDFGRVGGVGDSSSSSSSDDDDDGALEDESDA